jgi:hypothetical protein
MGYEVASVGVVHGALRLGLPGREGTGIVRENADDMNGVHVPEGRAGWVKKLTAENEVQALGHGVHPLLEADVPGPSLGPGVRGHVILFRSGLRPPLKGPSPFRGFSMPPDAAPEGRRGQAGAALSERVIGAK